MHNFPVPYPNELVYSTVARAGIYHGITSPKQLLDEVFQNRKVIATLDLPCHLQAIANQLQSTGRYSVEELVYQHTLFPIYAPFVTEDHKIRALQMMAGRSQGAVHLILGMAASRIQSNDRFKYCPECMKNQHQQHGENFWQRNWFFPGLAVCPEHGPLSILKNGSGSHRHHFNALHPLLALDYEVSVVNTELIQLAKYADKLLNILPACSPDFSQWTAFYRDLASSLGFCRGKHIRHEEIHEQVNASFHSSTLLQLNLDTKLSTNTGWLTGIFRKHRKAFSYLEHGVVWQSLIAGQEPSDIIERVSKIKLCTKVYFENAPSLSLRADDEDILVRRRSWQKLVLQFGVLKARNLGAGQALYAWLYRNDKCWMLAFNAEHKEQRTNPELKVDWHRRDLVTIRKLRKLYQCLDDIYDVPRISANYLLGQLSHSNTIKKNLDKLPLVKMFLQRYTESITEYQLRRLTTTCVDLLRGGEPLKKWVVLRQAGLSQERLTADAQTTLDELRLF